MSSVVLHKSVSAVFFLLFSALLRLSSSADDDDGLCTLNVLQLYLPQQSNMQINVFRYYKKQQWQHIESDTNFSIRENNHAGCEYEDNR